MNDKETKSQDTERPRYQKADGTFWIPKELRKVLGSNFIESQHSGWKIVCLDDPKHQLAFIEHERRGDSFAGFSYDCIQCRGEYGASPEALAATFKQWLSEHELVDGRWLRHSNPFDYDIESMDLAFIEDQEGHALFYRGGVHFVYGKPGTFKSWLALWTLKFADVRIWDFENGMAGTRSRLESLGVTRDAAHGYTVPSSSDEIAARVLEYVFTKPDVLCIDSFSGFANVMGINPESNHDVMRAYTDVFYPLKKAGVTVIILDHLPKDSGSDDYPIGAQAKKSQADAAYLFKNTSSHNEVDVFVSKDRHGELLDRCEPGTFPRRYGRLTLESDENTISIRITPAYQAEVDGDAVSASEVELMQAIYDFVAANPESNKGEIERKILGKTERKRKALSALKDGGYLVTREVGTSHVHTVGKEFIPQWTPIGA